MNQRQDYTEGNLSRYFIALALPLIAGNILQQLYNMVDALVVSWYATENEFAAVGVAGSVLNLFLFAIVGACIGISVVLAQLIGAEDIGGSVPGALAQAVGYLHIIAFFYLFCFTGSAFAGYLDGCGRMSLTMVGSLSHITLRAILSWCFIGRFGLGTVALATGIGWVLVNLFWLWRIRQEV